MATATTKTSPPPAVAAEGRRWFIIAPIVLVVLVGLIWGATAMMGPSLPRLNDNAIVLTKFMHSGNFYELPFDQQRQFYKVMDDRDAELDDAFEKKRLSESEYRTGLEAAWLGKHINRVEKYFSLPQGQARVTYVHKLIDKKERKKTKNAKKAAAGSADEEDIDPDETAAELRVEKWPAAMRTQWDQFHNFYRSEKKAREKQAAQTKPAA